MPTGREVEPGNLPLKAARMLQDVYESARDRGYSKERSARQAWGAVKKYYVKRGGRWYLRRGRKHPIPRKKSGGKSERARLRAALKDV